MDNLAYSIAFFVPAITVTVAVIVTVLYLLLRSSRNSYRKLIHKTELIMKEHV